MVVLRAVHHRRARGVRRLDDDLVAGDRVDAVDEVRRVERDRELLAGEVAVDGLFDVAEVVRDDAEVDAARVHRESHRRRVVLHEEARAAQRREHRLLAEVQPVRVARRDELAVVRVRAVDEPRADRGRRRR